MTPRGTDWGLAALVGLLFVTGVLSLFAGAGDDAWVFVAHDVAGAMLVVLVAWKLRRVWGRLVRMGEWDRATLAAVLATLLVVTALVSGWIWSSGGNVYVASYNLLDWHYALGIGLTLLVLVHAALRAKAPRRPDVTDRRQFLHVIGLTTAAAAVYWTQRPLARLLGWRGGGRRFTGSYEEGSFAGNAFPTTSWVADGPRTGGFYSRQRWRGIRIGRLVDRAGPTDDAGYVRVISHTGYRWSFSLADARGLLLATRVGDEPLAHEHGAPARLVAPGRRGFEWVKWVTHVELHSDRDYGAAASTVWSSFTPEGRGDA